MPPKKEHTDPESKEMTGGCNSKDETKKSNEPTSEEKQQGKPVAKKCDYTMTTNEGQKKMFEVLKEVEVIPELSEPKEIKTYEEASMEEVFYPLIDQHQVIIVAGAFFGDEGKGKTIDAIARHPKCNFIARTNSGENAGHTVLDKNGNKFIFHLAPSGLLLEDKQNFVGPEAVMDPVSFMEVEIAPLIKAGIEYKERLFIGNVHIVAPYHKLLDMICSAPNSSTLKGMSPIHASKVTKKGLRMDHIFNDENTMRARIKRDMETYYGALKVRDMTDEMVMKRCEDENADGVERIPPHVMAFAKAKDKVQFLVDLYKEKVKENPAFPKRCDVAHELRKRLANGEKVLLEGPQSYWLSNAREKFWESSTSADTTASGICATGQYNFQKYNALVINVHKAPGTSRVGIGANPSAFVPQDFFSAQNIQTLHDLPKGKDMCVEFDRIQKAWSDALAPNGILEPVEIEDSTGTYNISVAMSIASSRHHGETGATTLKPRICGMFDCVAHFEVNAVQGPYLAISALDRGDDYDKLGITIAYAFYNKEGKTVSCNGVEYKNGDIIKAGDPFPGEVALHHCYPIVKLVDGWKEGPLDANTRKAGTPFPKGVNQFLSTVEHFTGSKVISIGNGPAGPNIIYLKQ